MYACKTTPVLCQILGTLIEKSPVQTWSSGVIDISINYYKLLWVIMGLQDAMSAVLVKITLVAIMDKIQILSRDLTLWRFISHSYNGLMQELRAQYSKQWFRDLVPFFQYSHALNNDLSVKDNPHIQWWSHMIIMAENFLFPSDIIAAVMSLSNTSVFCAPSIHP